MDLSEFVEETLSEVLKGIRSAQSKKGGGVIGAGGIGPAQPSSLLARGYQDAVFTVVEFDVSVVAETSGGGKGALKVWSVGSIEAGGKRSDQQTNRVRFAVHPAIRRQAPIFLPAEALPEFIREVNATQTRHGGQIFNDFNGGW